MTGEAERDGSDGRDFWTAGCIWGWIILLYRIATTTAPP